MIKKVFTFCVLAMVLCCGAIYLYPTCSSAADADIKIIPLYIGNEKFSVEIAATPEQHITGLMFREYIPDHFGMLFVNDSEDYRSFWMKNCRVPLDIIYLDKNKQVINMHINVPPCRKEPCKTYESERPAQYVLELRGNRARELNIKPGDTIFFILDK